MAVVRLSDDLRGLRIASGVRNARTLSIKPASNDCTDFVELNLSIFNVASVVCISPELMFVGESSLLGAFSFR